MICERCHKKMATLKYTEVVKGKAILRNICETCLAQLQEDPSAGFEVTGAPGANFAAASRKDRDAIIGRRECSGCGMQIKDAIKSGRIGCPDCLVSFGEALEPLLRSFQISLQHHGKSPRAANTDEEQRNRLREDLRAKRSLLRSALKVENYEDAAVLRDRIRDLEADLGLSAVKQD